MDDSDDSLASAEDLETGQAALEAALIQVELIRALLPLSKAARIRVLAAVAFGSDAVAAARRHVRTLGSSRN